MTLTYRGINYQPQTISVPVVINRAVAGKYRGKPLSIAMGCEISRQSLTTLKYRGVDYFPEINHRVDVTNTRTKFNPNIA